MSVNILKELAYELYKQDWIDTHTTPEQRLKSRQDYTEEFLTEEYVFESYDEYLYERGFNGEIYACYDEFVECEYQDEEYMKHLLGDFYDYFKDAEKEFEMEI